MTSTHILPRTSQVVKATTASVGKNTHPQQATARTGTEGRLSLNNLMAHIFLSSASNRLEITHRRAQGQLFSPEATTVPEGVKAMEVVRVPPKFTGGGNAGMGCFPVEHQNAVSTVRMKTISTRAGCLSKYSTASESPEDLLKMQVLSQQAQGGTRESASLEGPR